MFDDRVRDIGELGKIPQSLEALEIDDVNLLELRIDSPRPHPTLFLLIGCIDRPDFGLRCVVFEPWVRRFVDRYHYQFSRSEFGPAGEGPQRIQERC